MLHLKVGGIDINKQTHLIAIDLDGTLLKDNKTISEKSKVVIQTLIELGHVVVIATGRSNHMSAFYYQELGLTTPLINSNGAHIHHPHIKEWGDFHFPIEKQTALDVIDLSYEMNTSNIVAAVQDAIFMDRDDERIMSFLQQNSVKPPLSIGNLRKALTVDPTLLMIYPNEDNLNVFMDELTHLHTEIVSYRNWGAPFYIMEVMNKNIHKASALKQVADSFSISKDNIIAFGDENNDLEMIDYAGIGVAMENATDELKALANYVTLTNEADGVANFLSDYFQLNK